jgi:hypothetical protein
MFCDFVLIFKPPYLFLSQYMMFYVAFCLVFFICCPYQYILLCMQTWRNRWSWGRETWCSVHLCTDVTIWPGQVPAPHFARCWRVCLGQASTTPLPRGWRRGMRSWRSGPSLCGCCSLVPRAILSPDDITNVFFYQTTRPVYSREVPTRPRYYETGDPGPSSLAAMSRGGFGRNFVNLDVNKDLHTE